MVRPPSICLRDPEVLVAKGGQLGQVGDAQHFVPAAQLPELFTDHHTDSPADALVDFIKDQGRDVVGLGQNVLQRQHQPRCFAA